MTLALKTLGCEQKKLAKRLVVFETQITKWKQGESISQEKQTKLRKLIGTDIVHRCGLCTRDRLGRGGG